MRRPACGFALRDAAARLARHLSVLKAMEGQFRQGSEAGEFAIDTNVVVRFLTLDDAHKLTVL